ncbi:MAG: DsbC family protein [Betaproteobacteria bacterium]|nr:MAG: DsbC family protein [Betaproteobacteria bacterium]
MKKIVAALFAASLLVACNAQVQPAAAANAPAVAVSAPATESQLAEVRKALEVRFQGAPIKGLRASVFPNMFEAMIGDDMIYFDAKISHFVVGNLIEAGTMTNLTEARTAELTAIDVKQLPLGDAIKFVRGKGERVMYVFTDVDCPFCTRLERTIQDMDNVTVYNFMFPIDSLHPDATRKQKLIWCAKDRLKAWQDMALSGKLVADSNTTCANPVDATKALGQKLGVKATPSFFLADGRMVAGALPKDRLEATLNAVQAKVAAVK